MSKPVIIIAESDEGYLESLESKFVEELHEKIEFELISDRHYFQEYFSSPRQGEILIVGEDFYTSELNKHSLKHIFVLSENFETDETENHQVIKIRKYASIKEIYNKVLFSLSRESLSGRLVNRNTQVIMVYSAGGGSGKTTVALGISACLAANHQKTVYISAEHVHNFQQYLTDKTFVGNEAYKEFHTENERLYNRIMPFIRNERFDYLPPFCASLTSLNIRFSVYETLIRAMKATNEYRYIIVDTDHVFDDRKASLLAMADKVLILVNKDAYGAFKTAVLQKNINCSNNDKYIFINNRYQAGSPGVFDLGDTESGVMISEAVEYIENCAAATPDKLAGIHGLQRLTYMLT
ncbi:MAG: AAA family ATPase [Peptococcaceae bacterium]|nr:AAA family ATPase [Peptococcaceae bacterium]